MTAAVRAYKKPGRPPCAVEECDSPMYARKVCVLHYSRLRSTGELGGPRQRGPMGEGSVNSYGYRVVRAPRHPLATAQGKLLEHRGLLFDQIGPGAHPCAWCSKSLTWRGPAESRVNVDHLDFDKLNNALDNLVVSCLDCNTKRRPLREASR